MITKSLERATHYRYHDAMIGRLTGTIALVEDHAVILDVGGVGYRVRVGADARAALRAAPSDARRSAARDEVSFWTHLVVRDDALELFGFRERDELALFEKLISVSGIGPKSGLAILDLAPVETLRSAIARGDTSYLTKISGIGRKTAQKIVLELRDSLASASESEMAGEDYGDVIDALTALGYGAREAREALKKIQPTTTNTSERVKEALRALGHTKQNTQ
jgi:Holliday junction DNA helicase RuvA